jgi:hypothetical protein
MTVTGVALHLSGTPKNKNTEILHTAIQFTKTIKNKKLC